MVTTDQSIDQRAATPVGLFLDVDKTLTQEYVQMHFARALGVEQEYQAIEEEFQRTTVASEFAKNLSKLFCNSGFNNNVSEEISEQIPLNSYADEVLSLPATKYLVTNGPSYYCHYLAKKYQIPLANTFSSRAVFDTHGNFVEFREGSIAEKADFVRKFAKRHTLTVGIGDSIQHDQFLTHCSIPILLGETLSDNYFHTPTLKVAKRILDQIMELHPGHGRYVPKIFIGCASESLGVAQTIKSSLETKCECDAEIWSEGFFDFSDVALNTLLSKSKNYDFAIFVMSADDNVVSRGSEYSAPRDNVVFEYGLFVARIGPKRNFIFMPTDTEKKIKIMSDIDGVTLIPYPSKTPPDELQNRLSPTIARIAAAVRKLGVLPPTHNG